MKNDQVNELKTNREYQTMLVTNKGILHCVETS